MIDRILSSQITELLQYYPIVSVSGPRQSGKTTLLRHQFPDLPYSSLEDPDQRRFALTDPRGFLDQFPNGSIIDEAQLVPELFSYLQTLVDLNKNLKFLISGSQNFLLMEKSPSKLRPLLDLLSCRARILELTDTEWAARAGINIMPGSAGCGMGGVPFHLLPRPC